MNDKKGQLQKAIMTNNMESVRDWYQDIFDEKPPKILTKDVADNSALLKLIEEAVSILNRILNPTKQVNKTKDPDEVAGEVIEEELAYKPSPSNMVGGMIAISSDEFDLPEDSSPGYKEAMENMRKNRKHRSSRDPYVARMKNCTSCQKEFDFNKEYPVGILESGANAQIKCNRCRAG